MLKRKTFPLTRERKKRVAEQDKTALKRRENFSTVEKVKKFIVR